MQSARQRPGVSTIPLAIAFAVLTLPAAAQQLSSVSPLSPEARAAMTGTSWQEGCPVSLDDLASVSVTFQGFDGAPHKGTIVVHKQLAADAAAIFDDLYKANFPIQEVAPWEKYGPRVYAEKNDTVAFYCEKAQDAPGEWSSHAYGYAIDINPLHNPFNDPKKGWWPPGSEQFGPRDDAPGKITPNSVAFRIFANYGWAWGGFYAGDQDYMHFFKVTDGSEDEPPKRPYAARKLEYRPQD